MTGARGPDDALFRELTEPLLAEGLAEEGTIMGFPCLRAPGGAFHEWARIPGRDAGLWRALIDEARAFATRDGRARERRAGAGTIASRGRE